MQDTTSEAAATLKGDRSWVDRHLPVEGEANGYSAGMIDFADIRGLLFRQRYLIIGVLVVVVALGLALTLLMKPQYVASATIRVNPTGQNVTGDTSTDPSISPILLSRYMDTQASVIQSRKLAGRVYEALSPGARAALLGSDIESSRPAGLSQDQWDGHLRLIGIGMLAGGVKALTTDENSIITITFQSGNPQLSAAVANAYADNFVVEDLRDNFEANAYARKYLDDQISATRVKLQDAEFQANAYAKAHDIVTQPMPVMSADGSQDGSSTITAATLASINNTYANARAKRIAAEQAWQAVANVPASQLPQVQQNAALQALVSNRAELAGQLADLRQRYGEQYPKVVEAKSQIATIDRQIAQSSAEIKNGLKVDYQVALKQEQALGSELGRVSNDTMNEQDRMVQYNILTRNADALRNQLKALLDRYNQVTTAANVNNGTITKLDNAQIPGSPSSPNVTKNMTVAFLLGVALAVGLAILRDALDDSLRSAEDVERKLGVPLLGQTPYVSPTDMEAEVSNPYSSLMEAYSSIRTAIDFTVPRDHQVIQFTSSQPSEGKSLTALSVAEKFAGVGRRVLLIDADLRRPAIASRMGFARPQQGIAEVLLGHVDMRQCLLPVEIANLDVLSVGSIPPNPVELLSSGAMADFLTRMRHQYDVIIVDSSPVIGIADAPLVASMVDATVVIVEANRIHFGQAKTALRRLRNAGAHVVGVILTKFQANKAGQGYGYGYEYYSYGEGADAKG